MRNTFCTSLLALITVCCLQAQLAEIPLAHNPAKAVSHQRGMLQTRVELFVPINESLTFCPDELEIAGIGSAVYTLCIPLAHGQLGTEGLCMTYRNTGSLGSDEICLEVCDTFDVCQDFTLVVTSKQPLSIPFVDDFSYRGPYPDATLWLDRHVYINNSLAERPLGLGVATFDGLDATGSPYERLEGRSDVLTSNFLAARDEENVFVSFFYQPRGFGIKPRTRDSLALDVRTPDGSWSRIWSKEGLPDSHTRFDPAPPFEFVKIPIGDSLLSNNFQLRFRNRSQQLGLQQLWHIDYVKVSSDIEPEINFEDIAFREQPNGIMRDYTAIPYRHFLGFEESLLRDSFDISLYSHFNGVNNANPSRMSISRSNPDRALLDNLGLLLPSEIAPGMENQRNLTGGQHDFRNPLQRGDVLAAVQALDNSDAVFNITTTYVFQQDRELNQGIPAFLRNNQTSFDNAFDNYMAYDDGTAESGLKAENNTGLVTIVQEYQANVEDQLQGVQFFFPRVEGDADKLRFNLLIWIGELDDEPEFIQESVQPLYADQFFDTLQGYTTYNLLDEEGEKIALDIPVGKFYIGWQQVKTSLNLDLSVGLDKNRPNANQFIYFRINDGEWLNVGTTNQTIKGALMIRPLLDDEAIISTSTEDVLALEVRVFPNPADEVLQIRHAYSDLHHQWYNIQGQMISQGAVGKQLETHHLSAGLYILRLVDLTTGKSVQKKVQIIR
ncbi:MAG: T9SS type A sorting domain-containing protein [Saprospiraceae bacterium]|nr:T9SS type A sorting domain-containing protein [Saprospiraceae bacterium]